MVTVCSPAVSVAPSGDSFPIPTDESLEESRLREFVSNGRQTVVVQGIGFVGSAMLAAVARVKNALGEGKFNVIGIDLADERNYWKIGRLLNGEPPVDSSDDRIAEAISNAVEAGNLTATSNKVAYELADVVVVDINLDVQKDAADLGKSYVDLTVFKSALNDIAERVREDALVVIETTVPPGTTERVVAPLFKEAFERKGGDFSKFCLAHAPERVMPGARYLESIAEFHRAYAGIDRKSAERVREFLGSFIDTEKFPLTELHSTTASETAKVLENAYRAANIAFIQEWTEFAHRAGVDLFQVIDAIRERPTHANIRQPGLGVGGYCLTKDSLLANWANFEFFNADSQMPQSVSSIAINDAMPAFTCDLIQQSIPEMSERTSLLLGISYLNDVADTRYSPTEAVYDFCVEQFKATLIHDPYVGYWPERNVRVMKDMEDLDLSEVDTLIYLVGHGPYQDLMPEEWIKKCPELQWVVDANRVITDEMKSRFEAFGVRVIGTGRGNWSNQKNN